MSETPTSSSPWSRTAPFAAYVLDWYLGSTTAAGLRAGVPTVIIPFFGDQGFWGQRVAELGVGTEPIPRKQLTAQRLAQAIQTAVTDRMMRQSAAALGAKIRAEDGIASAVAVIQEIENLRVA